MTAPATSHQAPRRIASDSVELSADVVTTSPAHLLRALLCGIPARISLMTESGAPKYRDVTSRPSRDELVSLAADHLSGARTVASTLATDGMTRAACKDYDDATEADMLAALGEAERRGLVAFAILVTGTEGTHRGGHLWALSDRPYAAADVAAAVRSLPGGKGETYPSGNPIRWPFGYHRTKRTRGVLVMQDRRRFRLDIPAELAAGLAAVLALPRNGKPEPAPAGERSTSGGAGAWGEAYKPEHWEGLPDGAALWASGRVKAVARAPHRTSLAALLRGERAVVLKKDGTRDDTDSAQVAGLVYDTIGAHFPEAEVRAIALHLRERIRRDKSLEHFRAQVDAEIERYRPRNYNPQPTQYTGVNVTRKAQQAPALPEVQYRPERKSRARHDRPQRVAGALGYLEWLRARAEGGVVLLSQAEAAQAIGCTPRTIKRYEKALGGLVERVPFVGRQDGRLFLRGDNIPALPADTSPADVVIADPHPAHQDAENAEATATHKSVHTAPPVTGAPQAPAAEPADFRFTSGSEAPATAPEPIVMPSARIAPNPVWSLPALVAAALDTPAAQLPRCRWPVVRAYVADVAGERWSAEEVASEYKAEVERRKIASIRTMNGLRARARLVEHRADEATKQGNRKVAAWWRFVGRLVAAEMRSRPPEAGRKPRKICEALPDLRKLGEAHQQRLLQDAAHELEAWRAERPAGPSAGCVPSLAPVEPPALVEIPSGWDMIARLKAQAAAAA